MVYATAQRQLHWKVHLAAGATIGDAIEVARRLEPGGGIPWDSAPVGIFGEVRSRADLPANGDRIELYRPLRQDPKARRRERLKR